MTDKTPETAKMGRPTIYSDELATEICESLMIGRSLRKICEREDMPHIVTIMRWLAQDKSDFCIQYAHARQVQAEYLLDEALDIADESFNDIEIVDGNERVNNEVIQRSKLRIDTRKWMIEKLAPKKYGNKVEVDNKSSDGSMSAKPTIIELVAPDFNNES